MKFRLWIFNLECDVCHKQVIVLQNPCVSQDKLPEGWATRESIRHPGELSHICPECVQQEIEDFHP